MVGKMIGNSSFLKSPPNCVINALTRCGRAQRLFTVSYRFRAQFEEPLLIRRGLLADNQRIGEVTAVEADYHGKVEDEHIARLENAVGRRAAAARRTWADGKVAIDDDGHSCRAYARSADAAIHVQFSHPWLDVGACPSMA